MNVYLACFDISDDGARRRVGKYLEQYGNRVQKSVFEISLRTPGELERLKAKLAALLEAEDDLRFYVLCRDCRGKSHTCDNMPVAEFPAAVIV